MVLYLIIIFSSVLCFHLTRKKNAFVNISTTIFLPALFAGLRDTTVGYDIEVYLTRLWNDCTSNHSFQEILNSNDLIEYGYCLFTYVVSRFTNEMYWFLLLEHVLVLSIIVYAIRKIDKENENNSIGTILYAILLIFLYNSSLCYARQFVALGLFIYSLYPLIQRKYIKYLLLIICATLFHSSAIFLILLAPLFYIVNNQLISPNKLLLIIAITGIAIYVFFPLLIAFLVSHDLINDKYIIYANKESSSHKIDYVVCGVIYILTYLHRGRNSLAIRYLTIIRCLCLMSVFLTLCGVYNDVASRIVMYLFIIQFALLCICFKESSKLTMRLVYRVFLLFMLVRYVYVANLSDFNQTIPYTSKILNITK